MSAEEKIAAVRNLCNDELAFAVPWPPSDAQEARWEFAQEVLEALGESPEGNSVLSSASGTPKE